jgi:hypothetical protein
MQLMPNWTFKSKHDQARPTTAANHDFSALLAKIRELYSPQELELMVRLGENQGAKNLAINYLKQNL